MQRSPAPSTSAAARATASSGRPPADHRVLDGMPDGVLALRVGREPRRNDHRVDGVAEEPPARRGVGLHAARRESRRARSRGTESRPAAPRAVCASNDVRYRSSARRAFAIRAVAESRTSGIRHTPTAPRCVPAGSAASPTRSGNCARRRIAIEVVAAGPVAHHRRPPRLKRGRDLVVVPLGQLPRRHASNGVQFGQ